MLEKLSLAGSGSKYQAIEGQPADFWAGVWHGSIAPLAFLISLFKEGVGVYEIHNVGKWYNFGFIIGAAIAFGGKKTVVIKKNDQPCEEEDEEEKED
jgi:hypothetical protein